MLFLVCFWLGRNQSTTFYLVCADMCMSVIGFNLFTLVANWKYTRCLVLLLFFLHFSQIYEYISFGSSDTLNGMTMELLWSPYQIVCLYIFIVMILIFLFRFYSDFRNSAEFFVAFFLFFSFFSLSFPSSMAHRTTKHSMECSIYCPRDRYRSEIFSLTLPLSHF